MRPDDAAQLHEMYRDPTTLEYISSDPPRAIEDTLAGIAGRSAHQQQHGFALWSVLELLKRRAIVVEQVELFGPIMVGRGPNLNDTDLLELETEEAPANGSQD